MASIAICLGVDDIASETYQSPVLSFQIQRDWGDGETLLNFRLITIPLIGMDTGGGDCIDFVAKQALCTRIFQITGGTGRFKNASGAVTLTMTLVPVLLDASNKPVFFAVTGEIKATAPSE